MILVESAPYKIGSLLSEGLQDLYPKDDLYDLEGTLPDPEARLQAILFKRDFYRLSIVHTIKREQNFQEEAHQKSSTKLSR